MDISCPSTQMVPLEGRTTPPTISRKVDLPAPLAPTNPCTSPRLKLSDTPFRRGEVHGLVGANGAGKSTFLDIVGGVVLPSSGTICVDGQEISIQSPRDAESLG